MNGAILFANCTKRITERRKTDFLSLVKNIAIKDMRTKTNTMMKDNEKYKENVFSELFIQ